MKVTKKIILDVFKCTQPYIHKTPVITSIQINTIAGCNIFFKCENFQRAGSFKIRGAINAVLQLTETQKKSGVVTHSSGNFAQGLALAAKLLACKAYIVMPNNAPLVKINAVKAYGAKVILCEPTLEARETTASKVQKDTHATFIHPYNQENVIIGHTSATIELLTDHPDIEIILTPIGGGGLTSGTAIAANYLSKKCEVIAAEPENVNDAYLSMQKGFIVKNTTTNTIADGLRTNLGDKNFRIIKKFISKIICVSEEEIIEAMKLIFERLKIVVEPSGAVPLAAVLKEKHFFKDKKIGIILSGGNVNLNNLPF